MSKKDALICSILCIVIGALFIFLKGGVISIVMTVLGVFLIVYGILDILSKQVLVGIIKIVLGAIIIVFGWVFVSIILYIVAGVLIVFGIYSLYLLFRGKAKGTNPIVTVLVYIIPVFYIVIGVLLLFNQGETISWVFIVSGILLIIDGCLNLIQALSMKS